ncbi:hypothetical protein Celal_2441 [Cellulophaga algicola DSM 14237]|uniref:Uncharacterized protein n=1 Tax=Cellulophaga algicola (strain DSM 14237 / IC166 / ACAM 630) TaxID=688270 RepID=E6X8A4_CELAD|nr:hypothetical protein Celal_2441 [Cellulophaga algicola DSM 14237]
MQALILDKSPRFLNLEQRIAVSQLKNIINRKNSFL